MPPPHLIESALESVPDATVTGEPRIGHGNPAIPIRIMLVEHDLSVRKATCLLLKSAGHEVITAESRADALFRLAQHPRLDLLMTDFHLGDGTGVEVIALARERMGSGLPAILLTGDTSAHVQDMAGDERLRIVSQPLRAERLFALIEELVRP
ncbi:MAG: response regulator [Steroidobacteraceae bacterium]